MKYLTLILTVFTLVSCGNSKDTLAMENNNQNINNITGKYQVSNIGAEDVSEYNLSIEFNEGTKTVSGFSGCNRFTGTYKIEGNSITFSPLASTRMACMDPVNNIELNMLEALSKVNIMSFNNQTLSLLNGENMLLKASQESDYIIEYTAMSRGLFNQYIFENGKLSVQKDRASTPATKNCTQEETNKLLNKVGALDLKQLKTLEAPSEKRFYDGAAIATLKITYLGETYQTPEFDNGKPNDYIASLVSSLIELAEKQ